MCLNFFYRTIPISRKIKFYILVNNSPQLFNSILIFFFTFNNLSMILNGFINELIRILKLKFIIFYGFES